MNEVEKIRERYARRTTSTVVSRYDPLSPYVYMGRQEWERALIRWVRSAELTPLNDKKLLDVGCGGGGNLNQFVRLGFEPHNLVGIDLLDDAVRYARSHVPPTLSVIEGDASSNLGLEPGSYDIVFQSTVFTSILDDSFQRKLADRMWSLVKPGGGILWYDFVYNNPANRDVRGVPVRRIRDLFPTTELSVWRLTLAPPLGRRVTTVRPELYTPLNLLPLLRTHVMCWIRKLDGPELSHRKA